MEQNDSQLEQLFKPRFENMDRIKNGWGRKAIAKRNCARKPAKALDSLVRVAKDYTKTKVFKQRKLSSHKIVGTEKATSLVSKQLQPIVAAPVGGVAMTEAPQKSHENKSTEVTCARSNSEKLPSNLQSVRVKSEASEEENGLVDFEGLAMIPRCHASLLKRECIDHPELAICSGRTLRWRQFAYETLGELMFFLRSTRRGEMARVEKRTHLAQLWEDARGLGFDLSWLERVVKFGLDSGSYLEQQCEDVATLESEIRRLGKERDTLRCQLSTLTMLLVENERACAGLELVIQRVKGDLKLAEEAVLY